MCQDEGCVRMCQDEGCVRMKDVSGCRMAQDDVSGVGCVRMKDVSGCRMAQDDQTAVRLAERKERRTDWVMDQWGNTNARLGQLLDLLERQQLLRPRDSEAFLSSSSCCSSHPNQGSSHPLRSSSPMTTFRLTSTGGRGGFGVVYRATLRKRDCAVKRLKQDTLMDWALLKESFQTEVDKLSKFRHPNIVELLGF
ncbi:hypothetical protein F7725_001473, partial [Dissostichus mawsoni]